MKSLEAWRIVRDIREGVEDPVEHADRVLSSIRRWEPRVNAFITLEAPELVLEEADHVSRIVGKGGDPGRLAGLIVSIKDNISTEFMPTTAGSRMLDGYIPPYNATVVERLLREGAIIVGKTNLDEFAMGSTNEFSAYGIVRNPWDLERVPGGSSGGSAASLAYGGADLSLGSDTGGSVRVPASYTATVGLKPTYGLVSRYGLIPYGNSLEQISPMARSVRDLAMILDVISGWDPLDSTSLRVGPTRSSMLPPADPSQARICVPLEMVTGSEAPVLRAFWGVLDRLAEEGAVVEEESLPSVEKALPAYYTIAFAEAASNLARYDGILYPSRGSSPAWEEYVGESKARGFGREVKKRIIMGVYVLSEGYRDEYYLAATRLRRAIRDEVRRLASKCVIASPATPIVAPRVGERIDDPLKLYAMDAYTVVANLAGVPALVQQAGFIDGLPIGIQWMAGPLEEEKLISLGLLVEELTGIRGVIAE